MILFVVVLFQSYCFHMLNQATEVSTLSTNVTDDTLFFMADPTGRKSHHSRFLHNRGFWL